MKKPEKYITVLVTVDNGGKKPLRFLAYIGDGDRWYSTSGYPLSVWEIVTSWENT